MKYTLSFGDIIIIANNIAEIIVDEGTVMTLEMCEEYDEFLMEYFTEPFAILVNKLHNYSYTFEAKLHLASLENLQAFAVVTYNKQGAEKTKDLAQMRACDGWNLKEFSGLQMGRKKALKWLEKQLITIKIKD